MKKGLLISLFIHSLLLAIVVSNVSLFPDNKVRSIKIKMISTAEFKKIQKKVADNKSKQKAKKAALEKVKEKIRTQQSAAPKQAPKKTSKTPNKGNGDARLVSSNAKNKIQNKKAKKQNSKNKKSAASSEFRPEKLDKTKGKKQVVKSSLKNKAVNNADDFLAALAFINDLKDKEKEAESKLVKSEELEDQEEEATLNIADQSDIAILKKHIERNWYKTPGTKDGLTIQIRLKLNRDGTLQSMRVIKGSGSPAFDRSLERAVRKSVPLPLPLDKYDIFKDIDIYWNG